VDDLQIKVESDNMLSVGWHFTSTLYIEYKCKYFHLLSIHRKSVLVPFPPPQSWDWILTCTISQHLSYRMWPSLCF